MGDQDPMAEWHLTNLSLGLKIVYGVIASLGIMGNGLVIYVLTHMVKSRKGNINILIVNQSIIDLVTSILLILCFLTPEPDLPASSPVAARFLCSVWNSKYLFWATIITSSLNLVCLTGERYFAIVYPFKYRSCSLLEWPKSLLLACLPWVVGYTYQSYYAAMHIVQDGRCVVNEFSSRGAQIVYSIFILTVTYLFPLTFMIIAYARIYKTLRDELICHIPSGNSTNRTNHEQLMEKNNERTRRNIIKTLILVSLVFAVCWALNEVCYFYFNVSGTTHINETLYNVSVCLAFFNMCANPIIYTFKYRRFQEGLRQALPCLRRTETTPTTSHQSPEVSV
ncbi:galanin receptor 2b-like [Asterias amurensis]|uniref:galanin receptor 2b-like n=1 Tax=Asterias amurensis TaxID=7602 RepID=UPI003AB3CC97